MEYTGDTWQALDTGRYTGKGPIFWNILEKHYEQFVTQLGLDSGYLLHFGMDGPNVNRSFEKKMCTHFAEMNTSFLRIGSCSLHPVHTAFGRGIKTFFLGTVTLDQGKEKKMQRLLKI